ncbi:MAG TPA: aminotransferase class I/II-fold pyridoxal phosphate-dependent enzyme [Pseudonocardiaceae bacterium]
MNGLRTSLDPADPVVAGHRIGGTPVLAAAAQVDALLMACEATAPDRQWRLEHLTFTAPLRVTGATELITTVDDEECTVAARTGDGEPAVHARARVTGTPLPPPRYVALPELRAGCTEEVPLAEIAGWRAASGIDYGPAFRVIRTAHRGPDRMVVLLRPEEDDLGAHQVPPGVLDSLFQCLGMLDGGASGRCLPWYVGRLTARRRVTGTVLALVEREPGPSAAVRGRATVCSQQGEVLLELERITLKATPADPTSPTLATLTSNEPPTAPPAPAITATSDVTERRLQPVPAAPHAAVASRSAASPDGVAPAVAAPRRAGGGSIAVTSWSATTPTPEPAPAEGTTLVIARGVTVGTGEHPAVHVTPDDLHSARLDDLLAAGTPREVVYLAPRDVTGAQAATAALHGVFTLVRRLAERPPMPDLTVVTTGAHDVTGGEDVEPFQTALWGLIRTLRIEYPRARVRLVDLGRDGAPTEGLRHDQPELAWRDGTWYAPALTPVPAPPPVSFAGGRYLVTGGMGGIGLHIAELLAADGCAHLTLVGRTVPDGERRERLDRLADACDLRVLVADVRTLRTALADAEPFDGVFHAAGVLRDGLARSLTHEQIDQVLGPKVGGVHALDEALPARPGFVALFSSIAAVHGNLGQSSYATANAYLDGYAARRRATGERWYGLGWGLWTVGMGEGIVGAAAARGVPALSAADGLALLRAALALPPANHVLSAAPTPKDDQMTLATPESGLWQPLSAILRKTLHVKQVSPDDNLLELGLDSMMAVEVAAALTAQGLDVDPMAFFEHTDVDALLRHLESLPRTASPAAAIPAPAAMPPAAPAPTAVAPAAPAPAPPAAVPTLVTTPAPPAPTAPPFVPDWDRFRDDHATPPAAAPVPQAIAQTPPRPPAASPIPVATAPTAPPAPAPLTPPAAPTPPAFTPPSAGLMVPRRTLPGRLTELPDGTFLDRRIDALSVEDRVIVAQDDYFYEPVIEEAHGSWIRFDGRWFLNFASYSYLGLIGHDYIDEQTQRAIRRHGTGAHGVRLLAGTLHLHRELELAVARFVGAEDAVVFSSGYMANVATVGALVGPNDVIIGDVYNHASILDGYRLSGAKVITYAHNDLADLERALRRSADAPGRLVVTDAVFSMDGDVADLPGILELCERYDAPLMVDEAHSLGVLGATGRGITEHFGIDPARVPIKMGTLSKTIPSAGGYVAGSADLVFALKNNARGWMFSAATTPAQVAAARAAIDVMATAPGLAARLKVLTDGYRDRLRGLGFDTLASVTPVVPIICESAEQAQLMARLCQRDGLFVQPIVYPAVPKALPRLRTIVNLSHTEDDLRAAVSIIERAGRAVGLIP